MDLQVHVIRKVWSSSLGEETDEETFATFNSSVDGLKQKWKKELLLIIEVEERKKKLKKETIHTISTTFLHDQSVAGDI